MYILAARVLSGKRYTGAEAVTCNRQRASGGGEAREYSAESGRVGSGQRPGRTRRVGDAESMRAEGAGTFYRTSVLSDLSRRAGSGADAGSEVGAEKMLPFPRVAVDAGAK
ncbi:hypothetical protein BKA70DRAFT_1223077 [Coprinopsis sp. MPI-PUGE-AT-0042]|nr:hypothetical protein BKA70DRAFT_1223077 [Coprinopsis sp. MPI-PUGE-AT-0042]